MRKTVFGALLACMVLATVSAEAGDESSPRFRYVGMNFDVGAPDGAALGVVVRPHLNWLRLNLAGSYNGLAPGVRGGLTLDPINFPVAPTATFEYGHFWDGTVPGVHQSPEVGYDYANLHVGLEFGKRDVWRFYLRGGATWIDAHAGGFQSTINLPNGVSVGDPTIQGWLPSGKLGFAIYF